jgi:deferrochelatase/peroxidase EfeB
VPQPCQDGIITRAQEHLLVVALHFAGSPDPVTARAAVEDLREVIRRELAGDVDQIDAASPRNVPTSDSGELGYADDYDTADLTVTVGFSAGGIAILGVPPALQPSDLIPIPWAEFGDPTPAVDDGHIVLQVGADSMYVVEHVLRRIEHTLAAQFTVGWVVVGEQRHPDSHGWHSADEPPRATVANARALIGFHDGLSNLDTKNNADNALLVFVDPSAVSTYPPTPPPGPQPAPAAGQPGYGTGQPQPNFPQLRSAPTAEPAWTAGGSYLCVRASIVDSAKWDQQTLGTQEQAVGRWKDTGASLDNPDESSHRGDPPLFATTPADAQVPATSHMRRANPRAQSTDALRRVFRRGYPLIAADPGHSLQRGLLFVCFGRSLSTQFEFIMRAWLRNTDFPTPGAGADPLLAFETSVLAGGYYFVPPITTTGEPWSWAVPPGS